MCNIAETFRSPALIVNSTYYLRLVYIPHYHFAEESCRSTLHALRAPSTLQPRTVQEFLPRFRWTKRCVCGSAYALIVDGAGRDTRIPLQRAVGVCALLPQRARGGLAAFSYWCRAMRSQLT